MSREISPDKYTIVPATVEDAQHVYDNIRVEDLEEWRAGSGLSNIRPILLESATRPGAYACRYDGEPLLVGGTDPMEGDPRRGIAWMACTVRAPLMAYGLRYLLEPYLLELEGTYDLLSCWADKRNRVHHEWIVWLGFDLMGEVPYGPYRLPFYEFERINHVHRSSGPRPGDGGRGDAGRGAAAGR